MKPMMGGKQQMMVKARQKADATPAEGKRMTQRTLYAGQAEMPGTADPAYIPAYFGGDESSVVRRS